jgi:hypothetical protein
MGAGYNPPPNVAGEMIGLSPNFSSELRPPRGSDSHLRIGVPRRPGRFPIILPFPPQAISHDRPSRFGSTRWLPPLNSTTTAG